MSALVRILVGLLLIQISIVQAQGIEDQIGQAIGNALGKAILETLNQQSAKPKKQEDDPQNKSSMADFSVKPGAKSFRSSCTPWNCLPAITPQLLHENEGAGNAILSVLAEMDKTCFANTARVNNRRTWEGGYKDSAKSTYILRCSDVFSREVIRQEISVSGQQRVLSSLLSANPRGQVAIQRNGRKRSWVNGDLIQSGDEISTGPNSSIELVFSDGGKALIQEESSIRFIRFDLNKVEPESQVMSLAKGGLRWVTGEIIKRNPNVFKVELPIGAMGIRGTDFEIALKTEPERFGSRMDGSPMGSYIAVREGAVWFRTDAGEIDVKAGEIAFASTRNELPVILRQGTTIFR